MVTRVRQLIARRVSLSKKRVVLFLDKICCFSSNKPRVLELSIRRGQSNLNFVFYFVCCEERDYYCAVWQDSSVLTAARIANAAIVCKVVVTLHVLKDFSTLNSCYDARWLRMRKMGISGKVSSSLHLVASSSISSLESFENVRLSILFC